MTMTGLFLSAINTVTLADNNNHSEHDHESHDEHVETEQHSGHEHSGDFWVDFIDLLTNPAHLAFEFVFSVAFDFVMVTILYGIVIKKIIIPRLRKSIHEELDKEHGVEHQEPLNPKKVKSWRWAFWKA